MDTREKNFRRIACVLACCVTQYALAGGAPGDSLDLQISPTAWSTGSVRSELPRAGCLLRHRCNAQPYLSEPVSDTDPVTPSAPRTSLPLGAYGPATFDFNGARVKMNVSF